MDAGENLGLTAACVDNSDRPAFPMLTLPFYSCESSELSRHARVKCIRCALDAVVRAASRNTGKSLFSWNIEEHGEVGHQARRRHFIRGSKIIGGNATAGALVGVRREKEAIDEHDRSFAERRSQYPFDQLRARRHEQQRFRGRHDVRLGVEQNAANLVTEYGSTGLAHRDHIVTACHQPLAHEAELSALAGALRAFENYEQWARG